jgi:hypothetical protein
MDDSITWAGGWDEARGIRSLYPDLPGSHGQEPKARSNA